MTPDRNAPVNRFLLAAAILVALVLAAALYLPPAFAYPPIPHVTVSAMPDLPLGAAVKGRDGGLSFSFAGEKVFTYGDTVLSQPNSEGLTWVSNTMYHTSATLTETGFATGYNYKTFGKPANQWIPWTPAEESYSSTPLKRVGFWPTSQFRDPITGKQYLWYFKLTVEGTTMTAVGMGITEVTSLKAPTKRFISRPGMAEDTLMFLDSEGQWGNCMSLAAGGYLYAYYVNSGGGDRGWGRIYVARASFDDGPDIGNTPDFLERANWRFWNGSAWVADPSSATELVSLSNWGTIDWNEYLKCYLYVYTGFLSSDVRFRVADNPWGPFSPAVSVYKPPADIDPKQQAYGARAHKALERDYGRTLIINYSLPQENWTSRVPLIKVEFDKSLGVSGWTRY